MGSAKITMAIAEEIRRTYRPGVTRQRDIAARFGVAQTLVSQVLRNKVWSPAAPTAEERFWSHVEKTEGCWLWTGALRTFGYGQVNYQGRVSKAHRIAWELLRGPVPEDMHVLHRCDNPPCVNPAHLFLGTHADNMADMAAKGRHMSPRRLAALPRGDAHYRRRRKITGGTR